MKNSIHAFYKQGFCFLFLMTALILSTAGSVFAVGVCTNVNANAPASVSVGVTPRQVLTGDLNGDNLADSVSLVGNSSSNNTIAVVLNNGRGTLSVFNSIQTSVSIGAITLADFNLDGALDIAAASASNFSSNATPLLVYLGNGNGTFSAPLTTNFTGYASALTKGDFNNDGFPDIAIANPGSNSGFGAITILLNGGFGSFNVAGNFPVGGIPRDIQSADFNADNFQDVVVVNSNNTGSVLLGSGTGNFQSASNFTLFTNSSSTSSVTLALGDLNNDSRPDLAAGNGDSNVVSVFLNNGTGNFSNPATLTFSDFNYRSRAILIGQYVGDANADIAIAVNSGFSDSISAVAIAPGNGNGTFGTALTTIPTGSVPVSIADGDFNNDGLRDLITANSSSGDLSVLFNTGNGRFGAPTFQTNGNPNQVITADFNNDGNLDYAVSNSVTNASPNPNGVVIFLGDGNGGVSGTQPFNVVLTQALSVSDVNRDGRTDLITVFSGSSSGTSQIGVHLNRNSGTIFSNLPDQAYTVNFLVRSLITGDFNNDGFADIVVSSSSGNTAAILLGTTAGAFTQPTSFASPASNAAIASGNFNGDANLDLLFTGVGFNGQTGVFTLLGSGSGSFSPVSEVLSIASATTPVVADFNKDGRSDVAVITGNSFSGGTSSLIVAFGDGDGTFTQSNTYSIGLSPAFPSIADVNNDSYPDIIIANRTSNSVSIYLNNRNGTFRLNNSFLSGIFPEAIVTGDFNNDGRIDFSTANRGGNNFSIILNSCREAITKTDYDGDGRTNFAQFRPSNGTWYSLNPDGTSTSKTFGAVGDIPTPGDYDGDGVTDLALFRPSTGVWYILRSSTNRFYAVNWGSTGDIPTANDYDGDGRTDVAVFRPSNGVWYILRSSTPNGFFAFQFGQNGDVPVAGDYDGDGRADTAVYRNGVWIIFRSSDSATIFRQFGVAADKPVPGDYDGDGKTDIAVYRNGTWYSLRSRTGTLSAVAFGLSTDIPQPGDYDGDGKTDVAVFRPSSAGWYVLQSSNGEFRSALFGLGSDVPAASIYRY